MASEAENGEENVIAAIYAKMRRVMQNDALLAGMSHIRNYMTSYADEVPCRTSKLTGWEWVVELLTGYGDRIHQNPRMNKEVFLKLCGVLVNKYKFKTLSGGRGIRVEESVAMFKYTIGHGLAIELSKNDLNIWEKLLAVHAILESV